MNNMFLETLAVFISGLFFGAVLFLIYLKLIQRKREQSFKKEKDMILNRAKSQASKIERLSREQVKEWEEKEIKKVQREHQSLEENLKNQEYSLKKKQEQVDIDLQTREEKLQKAEGELQQEKEMLEVSQKQIEKLKSKVQNEKKEAESSLERLAMMTKEEAREHLQKAFEEDVKKGSQRQTSQNRRDYEKKSGERS